MTTGPALSSSSVALTMRPEILPFSSKILNALNMSLLHLGLHPAPGLLCAPFIGLFGL